MEQPGCPEGTSSSSVSSFIANWIQKYVNMTLRLFYSVMDAFSEIGWLVFLFRTSVQ
jgi:hypothetical protein